MKPNYKFITSVLALSIIAFWVVAAAPDTQRVIVTTTAAMRALLSGTGATNWYSTNSAVTLDGPTSGTMYVLAVTNRLQTSVDKGRRLGVYLSGDTTYGLLTFEASSTANDSYPFYQVATSTGAGQSYLQLNVGNRDGAGGITNKFTLMSINATSITLNASLVVTNGLLTTTNSYFGSATLVAGTNLVTGSACTNNAMIFLSRQLTNGTLGYLSYSITNGSNFNIRSSSATDTSVVHWMIVKTQ